MKETSWNAWIWWQVRNSYRNSYILSFFGKKLEKINSKTFQWKLRNFKKKSCNAWIWWQVPGRASKREIYMFLGKNLKNSALKHSTRNRSFKEIPEMLVFDVEFQALHPIARFRLFLVKYCRKSALKHSTGN